MSALERSRPTLRDVGLFRKDRGLEHQASLTFLYDRKDSRPGAYVVVCKCGWISDYFDAPSYPDAVAMERGKAAALAHDAQADTSVWFSLDDPTDG